MRERRYLSPSREFKISLRRKLLIRWDELYPREQKFVMGRAWRYATVGVVSLVVLASLGTGAYAYNSSEVTEESLLYPVKMAMEKIEEKVKRSPSAKAKFYLKKIARREAEEKVLEKRGKVAVKIEAEISKVENQLEAIENKLEKSGIKNEVLKEKVMERLQKRQERLEKLKVILDEKKSEVKEDRQLKKAEGEETKADAKPVYDRKNKEKIKQKVESVSKTKN